MKAIAITEFGGPEVVKLVETDKPIPAKKQVLIRVTGTSVNFADIQTRRGTYHAAGAGFPIILGLEATGIIEEAGSEVKGFSKGQRVIAFPHCGSYAEFVAADESLTFRVPDGISFEQAAACPIVAFTSYKLIADVARLRRGETVLVHAASGGVGTASIQIARALGAGLIIGTVGREEKVRTAYEAGADYIICNQKTDFAEATKRYTNGIGADIILDSIGGAYTKMGLDCLAPFGRLIAFGNASGSYCDLSTNDLHSSCRAVLGFSLGTTRKLRPELFRDIAENVFILMTEGKLKFNISQVFSLKDAARALMAVENGNNVGKAVIRVSEDQ